MSDSPDAARPAVAADSPGERERALDSYYALIGKIATLEAFTPECKAENWTLIVRWIERAAGAADPPGERETESEAALLEAAWGLLANVSEGFWDRDIPEWGKECTRKWRERYFAHLAALPAAAPAGGPSEEDKTLAGLEAGEPTGASSWEQVLHAEVFRLRGVVERLATCENMAPYEAGYINHEFAARVEFAQAALRAGAAAPNDAE